MRNTPTILLGIAVAMLAYALLIHTYNCTAVRIPYVPTFTHFQDSVKFRGSLTNAKELLRDDFDSLQWVFIRYTDSAIKHFGKREFDTWVDSCTLTNKKIQATYTLMYSTKDTIARSETKWAKQ